MQDFDGGQARNGHLGPSFIWWGKNWLPNFGSRIRDISIAHETITKQVDNIQMQQDKMKIGKGMAFKPKPNLHFKDVLEDSSKTFVIVKPCGFCNQGFHCMDVAITSCKHTFHPFYLGAMLKESNKCCVCNVKLILIGRQVGDFGN